MKNLLAATLLLFSLNSFAQALLNSTNFARLDVAASELQIYVPHGHCSVQIISNMNSLSSPEQSTSPVGPALKAALQVSQGELVFNSAGRLEIDLSTAHHGGFGMILVVKAVDGRNLKDVIKEIIPDENGDESNVILTLIGNDFNVRRCGDFSIN